MENAKDNPQAAGGMGCYNLLCNGILAYFFYTYAYNNPDAATQGQCFASDSSDTPFDMTPDSITGAVPTPSADYANVGAQFTSWFFWGFVINMISIVMAIFNFLFAFTQSPIFGMLQTLIGCPVCCGGLAWWIAGMVIRWRHIGSVCAGGILRDEIDANGASAGAVGDAPYWWKSGKFMNIYLIITLSAIPILCCVGCCIAAAVKQG